MTMLMMMMIQIITSTVMLMFMVTISCLAVHDNWNDKGPRSDDDHDDGADDPFEKNPEFLNDHSLSLFIFIFARLSGSQIKS